MSKNKPSLETLIVSLSDKSNKQYDELDKRLDNIEKVMIAQEINLKTHMKRSDNLELLMQTIQEKELVPLRRHVNMVEGALKLLGIISILIGVATGFISLFSSI